MAIKVHYQPNAQVLGAGAESASAAAARRANVLDSLRRLQQAEQFAAGQQLQREGMRLGSQERALDRLMQAEAMRLRRDETAADRQFTAERDMWQAEQMSARMREQEAMQVAAEQRRAKLDQAGFEERYSFQQKQELDRIAAAENEVRKKVSAGEWTQDQADMALAQLDAMRWGMPRAILPKEENPFPPGQGIGELWESPDGQMMTRNADGIPQVVRGWRPPEPAGPKVPTAAEINEATKALTRTDESGNSVLPTDEEIEAHFARIHRIQQRFAGGQVGDVPPPVDPTVPDEQAIATVREGNIQPPPDLEPGSPRMLEWTINVLTAAFPDPAEMPVDYRVLLDASYRKLAAAMSQQGG